MAIKEVGPLQTGSSAVATGRVEATCTVAGGLEAPRNLAERVRQVASGAHEVASSPRERLRAAETPREPSKQASGADYRARPPMLRRTAALASPLARAMSSEARPMTRFIQCA